MKEIFVVTAYTPDSERETLLREFIDQIDKKVYDIMVVSHTPQPQDLDVDYYIYDSKNMLLTGFEHKYKMDWGNNEFAVRTTEARAFNHILAAYRLFYLGIVNAKALGYEKCHVIEYDTKLRGFKEFEENSELLDTYNVVYYRTDPNYTPAIISFPQSFNLKGLNEALWFSYNEEEIKNSHTIEDYLLCKLNLENTHSKLHTRIKEGGIDLNLYFSGEEIWVAPITDKGNIKLFLYNKTENIYNIRVESNFGVMHWEEFNPGWWTISGKLGKYEDLQWVKVKINDEERFYDFNQIDKKGYAASNYLKNHP